MALRDLRKQGLGPGSVLGGGQGTCGLGLPGSRDARGHRIPARLPLVTGAGGRGPALTEKNWLPGNGWSPLRSCLGCCLARNQESHPSVQPEMEPPSRSSAWLLPVRRGETTPGQGAPGVWRWEEPPPAPGQTPRHLGRQPCGTNLRGMLGHGSGAWVQRAPAGCGELVEFHERGPRTDSMCAGCPVTQPRGQPEAKECRESRRILT